MRIARSLFECGQQFLLRPRRTSEIEVDVGQIEPRRDETGIELDRLPELRYRFRQHLLRAERAIRHPKEHVSFYRARLGAKNLLQLLHIVSDVRGRRKQVGPYAVQPFLDGRCGGGGLSHDRHRPHGEGPQHETEDR